MELSKQFIKLSKTAKNILLEFKKDNNKKLLFKNIKENIKTQNTLKSKHTRQSTFRGLLRNYFNFTDEDMKEIDFTEQEKIDYYESNIKSIERQRMALITCDIINKMLKHDILYLLLTSGRRINEILENDIKYINNDIYIKLNKKKEKDFHKIYILGSTQKWINIYNNLKYNNDKQITNKINIILKSILPNDFYKKSSHITRAIYIRYIYKYHNENNNTFPQIIQKYLHHDSINTSIFYQHINISDCKDFYIDYKKTNLINLRKIAKDRKIINYSKLNKKELIYLLSN